MKRVLYVLLALFAVSQFIRPDRSVPAHDPATDLLVMTQAPADIATAVRSACYDCHSYQTDYPWYAAITPVNWWLQDHINEARHELNFSRWDAFADSKAASEIAEEMLEGHMPPQDYTWMHAHAVLDSTTQRRVMDWFAGIVAQEGYPAAAVQ